MKKVFVIVVTYKGKQWYDKCFGSLRDSTMPVQTVVVDNTPGNEDEEYIKAHYPEVHLIKTEENLGFGKANNLGIRYALDNGCDYVFLLNQDAWLIQMDVIERLVRIAEQHPEYGVLSPMHLMADEKMLSIQYENTEHDCSRSMINDMYIGRLNDLYETDYVNAAAWLLPKKTLEAVGGFNPIFHLYGEDDDYLNRVHYHGLKVGVCPRLRIIHDHKPFTSGMSEIRGDKELLVKLSDMNKDVKIGDYKKYYWRKMIVALLKADMREVSYWKKQLSFLLEIQRQIYTNLEIARTRKYAWIYK